MAAPLGPAQPRHAAGLCAGRPVLSGAWPLRACAGHGCGGYPTGSAGRTIAACTAATTAGRHWTSIEAGLPSSFGFPAVAHPRDLDTLFLMPLNGATRLGASCRMRPRRSGTRTMRGRAGRHCGPACAQANAFFGVLRRAMAADRLDPAGVYFGTGGGALFASADEGESWTRLAEHLPAIHSVETLIGVLTRSRSSSPTCCGASSTGRRARWRCTPRRWLRRSPSSTAASPAWATGCAIRRRRSAAISGSSWKASAPRCTAPSRLGGEMLVMTAVSGG